MKKISLKLEIFRPNLFYSFNENYDLHWNYTSFKDKLVLDIGADYGTTAEFFLKKGAKKVIAVEGDEYLAGSLLKRCKNSKKAIGIHKFISSKKDIEELIQEYIDLIL
jgi:predicted rRNA methylase YqxC with S4 and FtsJ domains